MFPDNILVLGRDLEWFIGREIKSVIKLFTFDE